MHPYIYTIVYTTNSLCFDQTTSLAVIDPHKEMQAHEPGIPDSLYPSDRELLNALQQSISNTEMRMLYQENKTRIQQSETLRRAFIMYDVY